MTNAGYYPLLLSQQEGGTSRNLLSIIRYINEVSRRHYTIDPFELHFKPSFWKRLWILVVGQGFTGTTPFG